MLNADILYSLLISDDNPTWTCWLDRKIIRELAQYIAQNYPEDTEPIQEFHEKRNSDGSVKTATFYVCHLLSPEEMREIGFSDTFYKGTQYERNSDNWTFTKPIQFPHEYGDTEFAFYCIVPKNGSNGYWHVVDGDCHPFYDCYHTTIAHSDNPLAQIIQEQTDTWVAYLTDKGVLQRREV